MKLNLAHEFCLKFNRKIFVWFACGNYDSVPASQAHITRFRVIERLCVESGNKRSDRGALQYLLMVLSERQYRHFWLSAFPFFLSNSGRWGQQVD